MHWGIFVWPLAAVTLMLWLELPAIVAFRCIRSIFLTLNPTTVSPMFDFATLSLILPEMAAGTGLLLVVWAAYRKSNITLTDRRLIFRTGLFSRVKGEAPLESVEAITLSEPTLGRFLGYGTVTVTSQGGLQFPLSHIAAARNFHSLLQKAVAAVKAPQFGAAAPLSLPPAESALQEHAIHLN